MPNILIAEDERPIADLIRMTLKGAGYRCDWAPDGDRAADLAGAEDYIVKPFDAAELLARVETVLRRFHKTEALITLAGVTVDPRARQVWKDGEEIALTPKEYDLLLLFLRNPNAALYRDTIYEKVWGGELAYGSKTVDLHVQRLRKKVGWEETLRAVHKVGYRLESEP